MAAVNANATDAADTQASTTTVSNAGEVCRLTICGPTTRVELAVPAHVPIADLMPTVLGHLDPALATTGLGHDGWVLQRLGELPLDENQGTAAAGLYDGDILYLRPRDDQLPVADFDDLVDGIHTGLSGRGDTWRPVLTRRLCVGLAAVFGLLAVFVTTFAGSGVAVAITAGAISVLLLVGGSVMAKVAEDAATATVLGMVAVVAACVGGLAMPAGAGPVLTWLTAPGVLALAVSLAVSGSLAHAVIGVARPWFLALAVAGVLVTAGTVLSVLIGLNGPQSGAVMTVIMVVSTRIAPAFAAWLAGLAPEPVPLTAEEFQQNLDPLPSKDVLDRAAQADTYLTAFLAVLSVMGVLSLLVLSAELAWAPSTLSAVVAGVLLLQSRELNAVWHRLATMLPAVVALVSVALGWTAGMPLLGQLCVVVGLLAITGNFIAGSLVLPGRRLVPRWGRWGDILHWILSLAVFALLLVVTGFYSWAATWL